MHTLGPFASLRRSGVTHAKVRVAVVFLAAVGSYVVSRGCDGPDVEAIRTDPPRAAMTSTPRSER